jgi:diguanylate cyclase (GGDEF)-like protein
VKRIRTVYATIPPESGADLNDLRHQHAAAEHAATNLFDVAGPRIFVVVPEQRRADDLADQIALFGYATVSCTTRDEVQAAAAAAPPAALVCDLSFDIRERAIAAPDHLHPLSVVNVPTIFTASDDSFSNRLEAVRAGGVAYFPAPVDVGALVARLDEATDRLRADPYRVLIVDDSPWNAQTYTAILNDAGITTVVAQRPAHAIELIAEQIPDLILLDMYMPECNGIELAAVIRQQPELHGVPIVFLSVETDRDAQLAALAHGGDDFLTKPILPEHLVAAVRSRIRRARVMRSQMVRDSLTGLLNHSVTREYMGREVARARRNGTPLSMAMIDIDHFKQVNDTYGHAAGDQVLKSLARLLVQRLRASDVVGRYGGEEFAVIVPETDGAAATAVLDEIRARFAQVQHRAGGVAFYATFSAGVAELTAGADATTMRENADIALYQAKRHGRNQVVRVDPATFSVDPGVHAVRPISALPAQDPRNGSAPDAPQVLLVYADEDARGIVGAWLRHAGYRTESVADGVTALAYLARKTPDLVLLDAQLPGVTGLDVLARLRSLGADSAVVMLTDAATESIVVTALRRGADDYLRKPLDPVELQAVLERSLARLRLSRHNTALRRQLVARHRQAEREQERAVRVQVSRLPQPVAALPGYSLAGRCVPAADPGGAFYDWHVALPGRLQLVVGDVVGQGMRAALLMATVLAALRAAADARSSRTTLQRTVHALAADLDREHTFVRLLHATLELDAGRLRYVDAGHGLGFVRRANGRVEPLGVGGAPLGLHMQTYAEGEIWLAPGDAIIAVSPGLRTAWGAADPATVIADIAAGAPDASTIVERTLPAGQAHSGDDDRIILALMRMPGDA